MNMFRRFAYGFVFLVLMAQICAIEPAKPDEDKAEDPVDPKQVASAAEALKAIPVEASLAGVTQYFKSVSPDPTRIADLKKLVEQLGAEGFRERRAAERELKKMMPMAKSALEAGVKSSDPEIRSRAKKILEAAGADQTLANIGKCLDWLIATKAKASTSAIVGVLPRCGDSYTQSLATEVLIITVEKKDLELLWKAVKGDNMAVRKASILALGEILDPDKADQLALYLKDKDEFVRFATAISLLNLKDRRGLAGLVGLLSAKDKEIQSASHEALNSVSGQKLGLDKDGTVGDPLRDQWTRWHKEEGAEAKLNLPVRPMQQSGLVNTKWKITFHNIASLRSIVVTLRPKGVLEADICNKKEKQEWVMKGSQVEIRVNNAYAIYTSTVRRRDSMSGDCRNIKGKTWNFKAVRLK